MIKKEFLLVLRDKHALIALFVMPAIFILIMSISLRDQFTQDNLHFDITITNLDSSRLSRNFIKDLKKNTTFSILKNKQEADLELIIPKKYFKQKNAELKLNINIIGTMKSDLIEIFKAKITKSFIKVKLENINKEIKDREINIAYEDLFSVNYLKSKTIPNSTQQSVPSWIVFGMFFIIIPMSTIYINEKKQNTLVRLTSMNISLLSMTISKSIPYLIINQIQVWIMIAVGMFIVPLFDAPALAINGSIFAIIVLSTAISISAIGLSNLIAISAKTGEQATTIGGISNILLGAIGGVMIPKFIMPESMQTLANISPMSWGLDGFLKIFINSAQISDIATESLVLVFFGIFTLIISMLILQRRIRKGL